MIKLKNLSLLQTFTLESDGFHHTSLHPLIKDWIQLRLESSVFQEYLLAATVLLSTHLDRCWDGHEFRIPDLVKQTILIHIMTLEEDRETHLTIQSATLCENDAEYSRSLRWFAPFVQNMGLLIDARILEQRVFAISKTSLGLEHPDTLSDMRCLAMMYTLEKRHEDAEKLGLQVMERSIKTLGPEHKDTLNSMSGLAETYCGQKRYRDAEKLSAQVMETSIKTLGLKHIDTLDSMRKLAQLYSCQKNFVDAEKLYLQVQRNVHDLVTRESPRTKEIDVMLNIMHDLVELYVILGDLEAAEKMSLRALEMKNKFPLMDNHRTTSTMLLVTLYTKQKRWMETGKVEQRLLGILIRLRGPEGLLTLESMKHLAYCYKFFGRNDEAVELIKYIVERGTELLGRDHPLTLKSAEQLKEWTSN